MRVKEQYARYLGNQIAVLSVLMLVGTVKEIETGRVGYCIPSIHCDNPGCLYTFCFQGVGWSLWADAYEARQMRHVDVNFCRITLFVSGNSILRLVLRTPIW